MDSSLLIIEWVTLDTLLFWASTFLSDTRSKEMKQHPWKYLIEFRYFVVCIMNDREGKKKPNNFWSLETEHWLSWGGKMWWKWGIKIHDSSGADGDHPCVKSYRCSTYKKHLDICTTFYLYFQLVHRTPFVFVDLSLRNDNLGLERISKFSCLETQHSTSALYLGAMVNSEITNRKHKNVKIRGTNRS